MHVKCMVDMFAFLLLSLLHQYLCSVINQKFDFIPLILTHTSVSLHFAEALVFFEQNFTSFSEADGEQDIYLQMTGGPLSVNTSVTVYNLNTSKLLLQLCTTTLRIFWEYLLQ